MKQKLFLTFALLCAIAQGAWAQAQAVSYIYYMVNADGKTVTKYTDGSADNPTVLDASTYQLGTGWYVVSSSFTYKNRLQIKDNADVKIILCDNTTLTAPRGIKVNTTATLTIYAQSEDATTMGKLSASTSIQDWAAIGGEHDDQAGIVRIHGGYIEARSTNKRGAGIGGGYGDPGGMKEITIYGGKITAHGANNGAGIGAAKNNRNGAINIYGGEITATGGENAAGIGGAENRGGWDTNIYGGTIVAQGGKKGAGIGGGYDGDGGNLNFYGGTITATGGFSGAGIGGGLNGHGGKIHIYGGTINKAKGGENGAGIGGGENGSSGIITIDDGVVKAEGSLDVSEYDIPYTYDFRVSDGGAGIGGGSRNACDGGVITINGGIVSAQGGGEGAGIGMGAFESHGALLSRHISTMVINIYGGQITVSPSSVHLSNVKLEFAAAIGTGFRGQGGTINIKLTNSTDYIEASSRTHAMGVFHQKDKQITLNLDADVKVIDISNEQQAVASGNRVKTCQGKADVKLVPCDHLDAMKYQLIYNNSESTRHSVRCQHCAHQFENEAHEYDDEGMCTKCGYKSELAHVTVYKLKPNSTDYDEGTDYAVVPGREFEVPYIVRFDVPEDMVFMDWMQSEQQPSSWEMADGESIVEPGSTLVVNGNIKLWARYRYQYPQTWTWTDDLNSATLHLDAPAGSTSDAYNFNSESGDPKITITSERVEATAFTMGYVLATATVSLQRSSGSNTYTYTFTDERFIPLFYTLNLTEVDNIDAINGSKGNIVRATLTGRTLYKDGSWNTLCLPFDLDDGDESDELTFSGTPLEGATVKEFESAEYEKGTLTLNFYDATRIKAGRPYLIKWDKPTGCDDNESSYDLGPSTLIFDGVTISSEADDVVSNIDDITSVTFQGTYKQQSFGTEDNTKLFLGEGNTLYHPESGASIGAQRAYFQLTGLTAGELADGVRSFVLNFGEDTATGIISTTDDTDLTDQEGWYTLSGMKLEGKPTTKGLYIYNGKKVMTR